VDLPFEFFVAIRYLLAKRKQAFISLISFISILGVMVGVMANLIALALMTGLQSELRDRIVGSMAHVYVFKSSENGLQDYNAEVARLKTIPRVVGAAPVVNGQGIMTTAHGSEFVTIKGIIPALESGVTDIARAMQSGSLDALQESGDVPGIVIGRDLAAKLSAFVGDTVQILTPEGELSPMGLMVRPRRFQVVGIFKLGLYEFDNNYAFIHMAAAQHILGKTKPDYIELHLSDLFAAREVADNIPQRFGVQYLAQDWSDMNQSLFKALWIEKMAISIAIGLIVMVAALNIIASLVLLVMEKSRDIAILKTMGSSAASIRRIFMIQGLIIGLVGTIAGGVAGCTLIYVLDHYKLIRVPTDVYQIDYMPFTLLPLDFVLVIASAILICFVATIHPSRRAAKIDPAQALRYQ
jgi:lipoprotein-releasing system permease protein